jgi:hypothetical protein
VKPNFTDLSPSDPRFGLLGEVLPRLGPDPLVHPDRLAYGPAEELVHRDVEDLPLDVPECLLDPGERAVDNRSLVVPDGVL